MTCGIKDGKGRDICLKIEKPHDEKKKKAKSEEKQLEVII